MIHLIFLAYAVFCSIAILGRTGDYKLALWVAAVCWLCYLLGGFASQCDQERHE
jgi:hypothetical protein